MTENSEISNEFLIYIFTSPSGKSYIGQTKNLESRKRCHRSKNSCVSLYKAIQKYGFDNFSISILKEKLTLDDANYWERKLILEKNTLSPNGYNLRTGGDNSLPSAETIKKMSESAKKRKASAITKQKMSDARKNMSVETRQKISNASTGRKHTECAKKKMSDNAKNRSPEHLKKLSIANTGKKLTHKQIKKMSEARKGIKLTDEHRAKISAGLKNSAIDRTNVSNETKLKISKSLTGRRQSTDTIAKRVETLKNRWEERLSKKIYMITFPDGRIEFISRIDVFCKKHDLCKCKIYAVSNGKRNNHKGFKCSLYLHNESLSPETNLAACEKLNIDTDQLLSLEAA